MTPNLGRPSGGGETLGKVLRGLGGDFPYGGGWMLGNGPPDVKHKMQWSLVHAGHMGARIPEAQVKVLFVGPAVFLVGRWIRGG